MNISRSILMAQPHLNNTRNCSNSERNWLWHVMPLTKSNQWPLIPWRQRLHQKLQMRRLTVVSSNIQVCAKESCNCRALWRSIRKAASIIDVIVREIKDITLNRWVCCENFMNTKPKRQTWKRDRNRLLRSLLHLYTVRWSGSAQLITMNLVNKA